MAKTQHLSTSNFFQTNLRIAKLIWHHFRTLFISQTILLVITSVLGFVQPAVLAVVINQLTQSAVFNQSLITWLVFLVIVSITPSFIYTLQSFLNKINYLQLEQMFELEMVQIYSKLDVAQHENPKTKDLINRVSEEGLWRLKNFADRLNYLTEEFLSLSIASVILIQAKWWTLPILLVATLPELIVSNKYGQRVWTINSVQSEDRRFFWDLKNHFSYLPNLLELKLFQNFKYFHRRLFKLFTKFLQAQLKNEKTRTRQLLYAQALSQLANAFVAVFFIYQVTQGHVLIGTLTFLIATLGRFRNALSGLFSLLSSQYQDGLFVGDFFTLKDMAPKLSQSSTPIKLNPNSTPTIEFCNVSFNYPGITSPALKNINFTIEPGTKLALVGKNGAGKTTLVKLLCRFYDPTSGQILIDGYDLKDIALESWYHHLGLLFQEYTNYYFKVADAIQIGRSEVSDHQRLAHASKQAGSHEFISDWPRKYKQQLGRNFSHGVEPSIGQWQKLALARVFYRQPKVFVLDEPTASLDPEAEVRIFSQLESIGQGKTTILISHRFSTVRKAQHIVVLEKGRITESGTHQELLDKKTTYAHLFHLQAKEYTN